MIECGVAQGGVDGIDVVEQELVITVLLKRESEDVVDAKRIALTGFEIGDGVFAGRENKAISTGAIVGWQCTRFEALSTWLTDRQ